jgi:putative tryptophan/tyrosine transport system substrate-binding protein
MLRRDFIAGLGTAAAWPLAAWARKGDWIRRIGVLMGNDEHEPSAKTYLSGFTKDGAR